MYNPEFTHLQAELSKSMSKFLKAFQTYYFNNIVDDKIGKDFITEMQFYYTESEQGKELKETQEKFDKFKGKEM